MQLSNIGLRGRVILLVSTAFALLTTAFVWHTIDHRAEMVETARHELLAEARLLAARQQAIAARAETILTGLVRSPAVQPDVSTRECSRLLKARLADEAAFVNLGWARPDGTVVCAAVPPSDAVSFADRAWFRQALQADELVTSDVVVGRIVGKPLIVLARAMRNPSGEVSGVAYLSLDLGWLQGQLAQTALPEGHRHTIVDGTGAVVVRHPDPNGWTGKSVAQTELFRHVAATGEGVSELAGLDGMLRLCAYTPLLETASGSLSLWFSVPVEQVTTPARRELIVSLAIALSVLLTTLGLVYWGGERLLLRPMRILSRQLDKFAAGDLSVRTGLPHTADDIGRLAGMLDDTAARMETGALRLRAVVEAGLDALLILESVRGENGNILDFEFADLNARAEELLGMKRERVIGQKLCERFPITRSGGFFDKYVEVVETGTPLEEEFPIDTPEIRAKWLRHQVVRVGDGIAISSRDITAWKEMYAETRSQSRLRTQILKAAGEGIFGLDAGGRATFVNPAACTMLQWTEEELIGQTMHALHHHTRADGTPFPREDCPIYRAFRDGLTHTATDDLFWRKDGTSFPVEFVSTPMHDEAGELIGAVVSFRDVSERRAQEAALARTQRALRTLSAGNGVLIRATEEEALLQEACRVIVEQGGYRMAWVGYADDNPEQTITPRAWAGVEEGYLAQLGLTWADDPQRGRGPASRAIRSGEAQAVHDLHTDPGFAPWRALAQAHGYAANLTLPLRVGGRDIGALGIYAAESSAFSGEEIDLLTELGNDLAFGIEILRTRSERDRMAYENVHHAKILQRSLEQSIQAIAATVEARDPYTAGHQRRVAELAVAIGRELSLPEERIQGLHLAGVVHDLGKIQVPAEILAKPGRLTQVEFMLIQVHPEAGYEILKDIEFPWPIAEIVRQHHEKMDGSGYPRSLKDSDILLESRIMTVADVVEAMASHRPYRPALGVDKALAEIDRGKGSAYDVAVADACLHLFRDKGSAWLDGQAR